MNVLAQTESTLKKAIAQAVMRANLAEEAELPDIILEIPKEKGHGDFATNIAMQLARIAKKPPRKIAEQIKEHINVEEGSIEKIEIAGPGFINFFMKRNFLQDIIPTILKAGKSYGETDDGKGMRAQVEFVSVNPTGSLHLGHARGAAFGDVLSNILTKAGYDVEREYYINDAGQQIDNLALSIEARYLQALGEEAKLPEDGYYGKDVQEVAEVLAKKDGDKWVHVTREERLAHFKEHGLSEMLKRIKADLERFGVVFDHWFSERSLYKDEQITDAIKALDEAGYIYEKDGATWLKSTAFGDDKDRVLVKNDRSYTYLTPDIAYHKNKFERGFDLLINVWGADHHGYISRMHAAMQALGYDKDRLIIKVTQMVNLLEKGQTLRMSKRSGNTVPLRELMDNVGVDAARYFFVARSNDTHLDFDTDLAQTQSTDNPVYYVQYAHARICTMLKQAESVGYVSDEYDASLLSNEKEVDLLKKLGEFPSVVSDAAKRQAPHMITQYVYDLSALLHSFYNAEKVLDEANEALTSARVALMKAVKITIANGLAILGVSAPERM